MSEDSVGSVDHERRARDLLREARNAHSEQARADLKREARTEAAKVDDKSRRDELQEGIRHV